jgi:RHS repeat-associated protein
LLPIRCSPSPPKAPENRHWYEYDDRGRVIVDKVRLDDVTWTTEYSYDAADRPLTTKYPDGEIVTTAYNAQGLPQSLGGTDAYVTSATYNALGQTELLQFGNGTQTDYIYFDAADNYRLHRIKTGTAELPTDRQHLRYWYDDVGNVSRIWDGKTLQNQYFVYDALDRLTSVSGAYTAAYVYDPIGNLTSKTEGGTAHTLQYTDPAHVHAATVVDGQTYEYDANGNQTQRLVGSDTYEQSWDVENRLTEVKKNGNTVATFTYDGNGVRVKKVEGGETTVHIGNHYEKNLTTGRIVKYYYFGGQRVAMRDKPVGSNVVYWIHGDHLGSTSLMTNASGAKYGDALRYYPYGDIRSGDPGTLPTDYLFTGQRHEDTTGGLYHMGARWYDPYINRFLSPDSIIPDFANPQSLNRYSYCVGNPVRFSDPTGHFYYDPDLDAVVWDGNPENESTLVWLQRTHPAPQGYHWAKGRGFVINEYYTAEESEFSGEKIDSAVGLEGKGSYREDFLYDLSGVAGQGTGVAEDGTVIGVIRNPLENWNDDWTIVDPNAVEFGVKGSIQDENVLAKPLSRVAVNPEEGPIPRGALVYILALDMQLADHDGFVKASDHSTALDPYEMDFYSGVGRASMSGPPTFNTDNYTVYFLEPY